MLPTHVGSVKILGSDILSAGFPEAFVLTAVCLCGGALRGADWPQFVGPNRDGVSAETGLRASWPREGPKLLWQKRASRVMEVLDRLLDTRWPVFVWGPPGVGKSSVVRAVEGDQVRDHLSVRATNPDHAPRVGRKSLAYYLSLVTTLA